MDAILEGLSGLVIAISDGVLPPHDAATALIEFLLGDEAQRYFTEETFEYPLVEDVEANADLRSIAELRPVELDLGRLEDLEGTLELLRDTGVLP
jgi:iron(III) transport system substrate-binding protein